jgi:hypothetical protein
VNCCQTIIKCFFAPLYEPTLATKNFLFRSTFNKQDLIANIRSGEFGSHLLTLDALSKNYRVSETPLQMAVRELFDEKYL